MYASLGVNFAQWDRFIRDQLQVSSMQGLYIHSADVAFSILAKFSIDPTEQIFIRDQLQISSMQGLYIFYLSQIFRCMPLCVKFAQWDVFPRQEDHNKPITNIFVMVLHLART